MAAFTGEHGHAHAPAAVQRPEQMIGREFDVGEEDLVELGLAGHLFQRPHLDTRQVHREQEERDADPWNGVTDVFNEALGYVPVVGDVLSTGAKALTGILRGQGKVRCNVCNVDVELKNVIKHNNIDAYRYLSGKAAKCKLTMDTAHS